MGMRGRILKSQSSFNKNTDLELTELSDEDNTSQEKKGNRNGAKRIVASKRENSSNVLNTFLTGITPVLVLTNLFVSCSRGNHENYAYVQTDKGQVVEGRVVDNLERSNDTLVRFVEEWLALTHNWSGTIPDKHGRRVPDPGGRVNGKPVSSALILGSKALQTGFSQAYLTQLQNKYARKYNPSNYVNNQGYEVVIKVLQISIPKKVSNGIWDINVLATRMHYFRGEHIANESFNQRIRVQAIRPGYNPLGELATPLAKLHENMQKSGLSIIQITALSANP
jgi:hypothetical protein